MTCQGAFCESRLHDLLGKGVTEMGVAANGPLVIIGDKLGLYESLPN